MEQRQTDAPEICSLTAVRESFGRQLQSNKFGRQPAAVKIMLLQFMAKIFLSRNWQSLHLMVNFHKPTAQGFDTNTAKSAICCHQLADLAASDLSAHVILSGGLIDLRRKRPRSRAGSVFDITDLRQLYFHFPAAKDRSS